MRLVDFAAEIAPALPSRRELARQLRATGPVVVGALMLGLVAFVMVSVLHFQERVSAYRLLDDPAPFMGAVWYTGALSYAAVILWCASATVSGFAGALLWHVPGERGLSRFLVFLAGFNTWLALDDLFVLHEELAERWVGFNARHAGEAVFFLAYAVILALAFEWFRSTIARTDYLLLIAAVLVFGLSAALDVVLQLRLGGRNVIREAVISRSWGGPVADISEELLKLVGGVLWFAYLWRVGFAGVRDAMHPAVAGATVQPGRTVPKRTRRHAKRH